MFTGTNFCDGFFKTSSSFSDKNSELLMSEISTSCIQHSNTYFFKKTEVLRQCHSKSFSCIAFLSCVVHGSYSSFATISNRKNLVPHTFNQALRPQYSVSIRKTLKMRLWLIWSVKQ